MSLFEGAKPLAYHQIEAARFLRSCLCGKTEGSMALLAIELEGSMANNVPMKVSSKGLYFISGQLPDNLSASAGEQAASALGKILALLEQRKLGRESILKMTLYVSDMSAMPEINEAYQRFFKGCELPARSAFGVSALGQNAKIEIDCYGEL